MRKRRRRGGEWKGMREKGRGGAVFASVKIKS